MPFLADETALGHPWGISIVCLSPIILWPPSLTLQLCRSAFAPHHSLRPPSAGGCACSLAHYPSDDNNSKSKSKSKLGVITLLSRQSGEDFGQSAWTVRSPGRVCKQRRFLCNMLATLFSPTGIFLQGPKVFKAPCSTMHIFSTHRKKTPPTAQKVGMARTQPHLLSSRVGGGGTKPPESCRISHNKHATLHHTSIHPAGSWRPRFRRI